MIMIAGWFKPFVLWFLELFHFENLLYMEPFSRQVLGMTCKIAPKFCEFMDEGFFSWNYDIDNTFREGEYFSH